MARKQRTTKRPVRRQRKHVPGWGGAIGRLAGVGMKYATKDGMAYKALKLARRVADAVNIEYKICDISSNAGATDYNGGVASLVSIAQGTTDSTRIGDSCKLQNLTFRWQAARNGQDAQLRFMLIWDPQNQITGVTDVLASIGSNLSIVSPKNYDKRFRSRVLHDQTVSLTSGNATIHNGDIVISINQHTQFSAATTTILTGDLKLLVISNVVTTNLPTFSYYSRLSFTDN